MTDFDKTLDRLRRMCSRREYCTEDIRKKAAELLENDEDAARCTASLIEQRYVDDLRYSCAFARDKSSIAGWGTVKIRHALAVKKIPAEIINEAIGEIDEEKSASKLHKLLEIKCRSLKDDPQRRLKLLRFALGRGYLYDEVISVLDSLTD